MPPALVATFPPRDPLCSPGDTGYTRPSGASSPFSCSRVTPGSTTATWFSVSISTIRFMRSKASRMPSATGHGRAREAGAAAPGHHGNAVLARHPQDLGHLVGRTRQHEGQRNHRARTSAPRRGCSRRGPIRPRGRCSRRRPCAVVPGVPTSPTSDRSGGPTLPGLTGGRLRARSPRPGHVAAPRHGARPPLPPSAPLPSRVRRWSAASPPTTGWGRGWPSRPNRSVVVPAAPELVFGPGQRHVEKAPLLVDGGGGLRRREGHQAGPEAQDDHRGPLQALGAVEGGEDHVIPFIPGRRGAAPRCPSRRRASRRRRAGPTPGRGPRRRPRFGTRALSSAAWTTASWALVRVSTAILDQRRPGVRAIFTRSATQAASSSLDAVGHDLGHRPVHPRGARQHHLARVAERATLAQDGGRHRDHLGRAAVVLVQPDDRGAPQDVGQTIEQRGVGAVEPVDRLVGVADHEEVGLVGQHGGQQAELGRVDVLHLVDEQMPGAPADGVGELGVTRQRVGAGHDEVVEVEESPASCAPSRTGRTPPPPARR